MCFTKKNKKNKTSQGMKPRTRTTNTRQKAAVNRNRNMNVMIPMGIPSSNQNQNIEDDFDFKDLLNDPTLHMNVYDPIAAGNFQNHQNHKNDLLKKGGNKSNELYFWNKAKVDLRGLGADFVYITGVKRKKWRDFVFLLDKKNRYCIFNRKKKILSFDTNTSNFF